MRVLVEVLLLEAHPLQKFQGSFHQGLSPQIGVGAKGLDHQVEDLEVRFRWLRA